MINLVSVLEALDQLGDGRKHMLLPAVSKLFADGNGLAILLQPSALAVHSQMIELICYFSGDAVSSADLNEAAKRGVAAISRLTGHGCGPRDSGRPLCGRSSSPPAGIISGRFTRNGVSCVTC